MLSVSNDFKIAIAADERQTYCRLTIDYSDPALDSSLIITANEECRITQTEQVADNLEIIPAKWAALDGSWTLDTDYYLAPDTAALALENQMGWWGAQFSDGNGNFAVAYPKLTIIFSARPIRGLKCIGDSARSEYSVDFVIKLYSAGDTLQYTETVTGNTAVTWIKNITLVNNIVKMTLEITKWSHVGRQVKIAEFYTSFQEIYTGNNIIDVHLLEELESVNSGPFGSITANEIDVKLDNSDHKFDAGNVNSSLYGLVRQDRRVRLEMGVKLADESIEWVEKGTFWTGEWDVPDSDIYAAFSARDRLELFRNDTFSNSQVIANPADDNYTRDSQADWNDGTLVNTIGNSAGMLTLFISR